MNILIVDDSKSFQTILASVILDIGHRPIFAFNDKEALTIYENEYIDMVFMNLYSAHVDHTETAIKMRLFDFQQEHLGANIFENWRPIIFISDPITDETIEKAVTAGGDDFIFKPLTKTILAAKIHALERIVSLRKLLIELSRLLTKTNEYLDVQAKQDTLTGLFNRREFTLIGQRELEKSKREQSIISLCMIDVDFFKQYNDAYGHQAGDHCLVKIAKALQESFQRPADTLARFGGEEFIVLLPETTEDIALVLCEKLMHRIAELHLIAAPQSLYPEVTISIGIAEATQDSQRKLIKLIKRADETLYAAKEQGRNRFVVHEEE